MVHTAICDACDVVMEHGSEQEANDWVFAHVRKVHDTILDEADVIDLAEGGTETFIWPRLWTAAGGSCPPPLVPVVASAPISTKLGHISTSHCEPLVTTSG